MRFYIFLLLIFMLNTHSKAQKVDLTLEDLIPGGKSYNQYTPNMPTRMAWYKDELTMQKDDAIVIMDGKNKGQTIITVGEINKILPEKEKIKNISAASISQNGNTITVRTKSYIFIIDPQSFAILAKFDVSNKDIQNIDICNRYVAYTKGNNLYIQNTKGIETVISEEDNERILYGHDVHQREFGIVKGTYWSPNENLLAFYRMDESMVDAYPLVDTSTRMATVKERVYPMAGQASHEVTVGIFDKRTGKIIYLDTGLPKDKYLTNIAWSPDEKLIYIATLNRDQNFCELNSFNVSTGEKVKTLFTESHQKYVEPQFPIIFLKNDSSKFIWQSRKNGFNHLYLYDTDGNLIKQLTDGDFEVTAFVGFDEKGENIFYTSTEDSPLDKQIYSTNIKTGNKKKISTKEGTHHAMISPSGKFVCDIFSSFSNPGEVHLVNTKTNKSNILHTAQDPFADANLPEISLGSIKAADGETDLYYRLVKPLDFDENKKYPTIVYVYGGPHSQLVNNSWMGQIRGWDIYMAQKGYVVFTLDNRGTSNRGLDFENVTHRRLGIIETEDQMKGIEFLSSLPYIDTDRIGVHGWSYGGFMTLNLMLRHPKIFKVGVAGGPVTDWKYYEIMYGERYMDKPQDNPDGYAESSMLKHIGNLQGRLLLIYGDQDPVVVPQHTAELLKSAVNAGVHPDLFVYPGHEHNVIGKDRIHLHEHITRYFEDFLR